MTQPAGGRREITPRERLEIMIRTNRNSTTVWSASEVQDALDTYRAAILREAAEWFEGDRQYMSRFFGHQASTELRRMAGEAGQ